MRLYHINFHTARNKSVFLAEDTDASIRTILRDVLRSHRILCLGHEVMPTHVHLLLVEFPDLTRASSVQLIKGGSARRFLQEHPELRADLGDHLWQEGYSFREVTSHRQFVETLKYIRNNRRKGGLEDADAE